MVPRRRSSASLSARSSFSSGCIRLTNEDIVDLYNRTPIGAKVVVFGIGKPAAAAQ